MSDDELTLLWRHGGPCRVVRMESFARCNGQSPNLGDSFHDDAQIARVRCQLEEGHDGPCQHVFGSIRALWEGGEK